MPATADKHMTWSRTVKGHTDGGGYTGTAALLGLAGSCGREMSGRNTIGELMESERPPGARTIDEILRDARSRLDRLTPERAWKEIDAGLAILVDIRPEAQRQDEGAFGVGLVVERNVLEWRFDPASDAKLPEATGYDVRIIVACSQGYTSSLAAASLHDLGLVRSTDIIGGFEAWQAAGLPSSL